MAAYVFGYGSLLERASRTRTNPDAVGAWLARVQGFRRGWFHQFADNVGSTCTYLGAVKAEDTTINGVIYRVADFESTKQRETGYTATALQADAITMLDGGGRLETGADLKVYIFVSNEDSISKSMAPTPEFPMVQSYVDLCVNGCLELEAIYRTAKGFTQEFICTTTGWNKNWVNDRLYPRRPFIYVPNASAIDKALKEGNVLQYVQLNDVNS
jgi:hypothetical protein